MKTIHKIQRKILTKLLKEKTATFTELKPFEDIEGSHLTFHLKKLITDKFINKEKDLYMLSNKGKEYANRISLSNANKTRIESGNSILLICKKDGQYLIYTRKKHPFYGYQGFPSGKILPGEFIKNAAIRNLKIKTGFKGKPKIIGINHRIIYSKKNPQSALEDKYIYLCLFNKLIGEENFDISGKYRWVNPLKFDTIVHKPYHLFHTYYEKINNFHKSPFFWEEKVIVTEF